MDGRGYIPDGGELVPRGTPAPGGDDALVAGFDWVIKCGH